MPWPLNPYGSLSLGVPTMGILRKPGMPFGDPSNPQNLPFGLLSPQTPPPAAKAAEDDGEEDKPAASAAPVAGAIPTPPPRPADLTPQQPAQAAQAAPKEEQGFMGGLLDRLGNIYGNGGSGDALISLGAGLMSSPGNVGKGLMAGMELANKSRLMGAQGEMARNKLAGQNATAKLISERMGIPIDQAQGLVSSGGASTALSQIFQSKSPQLVDVQQADGSTQKQWITPGQAGGVAIGAPKSEKEDFVSMDVPQPDGSTRKMWVKKGEAAGVPIGAPTGGPETIDQGKLAEERAKNQAKQEAAQLEKSKSAEIYMPHVDRAYAAYKTLADLKAIGPASASAPARLMGGLIGTPAEIARQDYDAAAKELELAKAQISMKGQGAITDSERKILALTLPRLDAADPATGLKTLEMWRSSFAKQMGQQPAVQSPAAAQPPRADLPPHPGARKANDGNWYVQQGGRYYRVQQ